MPTIPIRGVAGLNLGPQKVESGGSGACLEATNLIVRYDGCFEPRPAIRNTAIATTGDRIYLDPYTGMPIVSKMSSALLRSLVLDASSSFTLSPEFSVSALAMSENTTLLMTESGLRRFYGMQAGNGVASSNAGASTDLGYIPEGLDIGGQSGNLLSGTGWLADGDWVAYRVVYGARDANNRLFLGAPGGRFIVNNTTGTSGYDGTAKNVNLRFTVPDVAGYTFSGTTTTSDETVTVNGSHAHITRGHRLYGTGVPANTVVASGALFPASIEMSNPATANGTVTITGVRLFYQIYRTDASVNTSADPGDEMTLVYEDWFTATDISNGYVQITDYAPSGLGGAALYTNETLDGALETNSPCEAVHNGAGTFGERGLLANYAECMFAAVYKPRLFARLYLLGVLTENGLNARTFTADTSNGSPTLSNVSSFTGIANGMRLEGTGITAGTTISSFDSGAGTVTMSANATATGTGVSIVAGDIITVDGVDYYAHTSESIGDREFLVSTNASAAVAIRETAQSFVRVFNRSSSTVNFYAHYTSGPEDNPGAVAVIARTDRSSTNKSISAGSHGQAWEPNLSAELNFLSATDFSRITYSKPGQPLAFPPLNEIRLPNSAIPVSFLTLRGTLLVLTTKGLFRIIGTYGAFRLEIVDESVIAARDKASFFHWYDGCVLANTAYFMSTQGIVATTGTGTEVISETVNPLLNDNASFGQPFVEPNNMLVFLPVSTGTLVYHARFDCFTFIDKKLISGVISSRYVAPKLYMVNDTDDVVSVTNNLLSYSSADLYDSSAAVTISSVDSAAKTITLTTSPSLSVGDVIEQGGTQQTIEAYTAPVITVGSTTGFSAGAATTYIGYDTILRYCPPKAQSSTGYISQAHILFDVPDRTGQFTSNTVSGLKVPVFYRCLSESQSILESSVKMYEPEEIPEDVRFIVPRNLIRFQSFTPGIKARCCRQHFRVLGIDVDFEPVSERTSR